MTDSEIIWKYLTKTIRDDSQAIYLYTSGHIRCQKPAIEKVMGSILPIFHPTMPEHLLLATVKGFFDFKRKQYKEGKIKVKSIY